LLVLLGESIWRLAVCSGWSVPSGWSPPHLVVRVAEVRLELATDREKVARPARAIPPELVGGRQAAPTVARMRGQAKAALPAVASLGR
jgi:hypothetical protein